MKSGLYVMVLFLIFAGCTNKEYSIKKVHNPPFKPNTAFQGYEDLRNPGFRELIEKYQLDTIFHGETNEFQRVLMLRHWIKKVIHIDDFGDPYPGGGHPEGILDAALKGQGFHCGHFMIVQNAIMNAYGYVSRTLGAGPGVKGGPDGHHGINEIWLNDLNKWFMSDAKYNHHFEKDGIPLSALEIRDSYIKNKAADIKRMKGPERLPTDFDPETGTSWERSAQTYTWIEFHTHNDMFSAWPHHETLLTMYADEFFATNTWIWDDKPHWAYSKPEFMLQEKERDAIEWTPNTIASDIRIEQQMAVIKLTSETPNLMTYQMKEMPSGHWKDVNATIELELKRKRHEWSFHTINMAGVSGPEHLIIVVREKAEIDD